MRTIQTRLIALAALLLLSLSAVYAQEESGAVLVYADDFFEVTVRDADGLIVDGYPGLVMEAGWSIETAGTSAELELLGNGTIIRLNTGTEFAIESLAGGGQGDNNFAVTAGRLRTVAATVAGSNYNFRTQTAVGGVRGTDFGIEVVPGQTDALFVQEGSVEFTRNTGETLMLGAGQFADAFAETFEAVQLDPEELANLFTGLDFEELDPVNVPGQATVSEETTDEEAEEEAEEEEPEEETEEESAAEGGDEPVVVDEPGAADAESEDGEEGEDGEGFATDEPSPLDPVFEWLAEYMGMEIGSITIDDQTYQRVVLQPVLELGDLRLGLYLPVIYSSDMFDPNDWYRPRGNDEWSFGMDQDWEAEPLVGIGDVLSDLALKIRFIEWGDLRDDFFLKIGNLETMSIGHGSLMRNYANDVDFPAVRRIGINTGLDFNIIRLEGVVNDIADPEIFGGRFLFRPFGPLGIAATSIVDIGPAGELSPDQITNTTVQDYANAAVDSDPIFVGLGADIDLPIIEQNNFLSIITYADVAAMVPYLRNDLSIGGNSYEAGLRTELLTFGEGESAEFRNYGIMAGVLGNVLFIDYRLEFRNFHGTFRPAFFSTSYDRLRGDRAIELMRYLENPNAEEFASQVTGVYGSVGASILNDAITLTGGYMWPWSIDDAGNLSYADEDIFELELLLAEDLLPFGIHGSIAYQREKFVPTLLAGDTSELTLFDANTVFEGEVIYPFAEMMSLAAVFKTAVLRNDDGTIQYNDDGNPTIGPSISIETRIGL